MNRATKTRPASAQSADAELRPENAAVNASTGRTIVNLLLFVHLFSVALLMVFNGSAILPADTPPKMLQPKLRRVPGYYLQLLGLDFDFDSGQRYPHSTWVKANADQAIAHLKEAEDAADPKIRTQRLAAAKAHLELLDPIGLGDPRFTHRGLFHLTYGDALDVGHLIEFRFEKNSGEEVIRLPSADLGGQRRIRYEMLAREAARLTRVELAKDRLPQAIKDTLPQSIVEHVMRETGVDSGRIAILRRGIQEQPDVNQSGNVQRQDAWRNDPWHEDWLTTVFERKAQRSSGGRVLFINPSADNLSAPAPTDEKAEGESE